MCCWVLFWFSNLLLFVFRCVNMLNFGFVNLFFEICLLLFVLRVLNCLDKCLFLVVIKFVFIFLKFRKLFWFVLVLVNCCIWVSLNLFCVIFLLLFVLSFVNCWFFGFVLFVFLLVLDWDVKMGDKMKKLLIIVVKVIFFFMYKVLIVVWVCWKI